MATLTLDKSRNALAVLAWRRGLTRKPFCSLAVAHAHAQAKQTVVRVRSAAMTKAQSLGVKRRR